ncbi:MAG: DUF2779 domain-containing protein [Anaerolineales bacterium]
MDELREFLQSLSYPLYYLDFETFSLPIPPYDNLSPYSKVPFQYSLHVQDEPGGRLRHCSYLAEPGADPRPEFLRHVLEDTEGEGDIVVYHKPFEHSVLSSLTAAHPQAENAINDRLDRMVDLLDPFRKQLYWHPKMGGSNSIKNVLPVFAPELSYQELEVENGEQAMAAFVRLSAERDPARITEQRQALLDYCELDSLAMARILDGLRRIVGL